MNKLAILNRWQEAMNHADTHFDQLINIMGLHPEGETLTAVSVLQYVLTESTADLLGDEFEWLVWFWIENDMGVKGMKAGPPDDMRPIKTLEDLLWLIGGKA